MATETRDDVANQQRQEAIAAMPSVLERAGLQPCEARVCLTVREAHDEDLHREVIEVWAMLTDGFLHTYDPRDDHWMTWPGSSVHWVDWHHPRSD